MIVRIVSAVVPPELTSAVHAHIREEWLPGLRSQPGMVYVKLARRLDQAGERLMLITEWRTVADLYRWAGDDIDTRHLAEGHEPLVQHWDIQHFESLDLLPDEAAAGLGTEAEAGLAAP